MERLDEINRYLLAQVKSGSLDRKLAAAMLGKLNENDDARDVAVIGMGCRFPGADDPDALWDVVAAGHNLIGPLSRARRDDIAPLVGPDEQLFEAGFLAHVDRFDAGYFRIPPAEATLMDPYQRLMLTVAVEAIEDAGYAPSALRGARVGVFVGTDHTHKLMVAYTHLLRGHANMLAVTGSCTGILASRLSYVLDLSGPALVVDTACSSALVALHLAARALQSGECDLAIVGGANVFLCPTDTGQLQGVESASRALRAFDRRASGTVWGEGVGALLLKPLRSALRDRDNVQAVMRGSAVNNDGASNGITAPRAESQTAVVRAAWESARVAPESLSLIEAHGTGTLLGDPIEVRALQAAFQRDTSRRQFCAIGSVKTNLGHTVGASGIASLIKVIKAMAHRTLPASGQFSEPNPYASFVDSALYLSDRQRAWDVEAAAAPRRAGVTSLGFSGTNAHVVLQEPPPASSSRAEESAMLFALSARTPEALQRAIATFGRWLARARRPHLHDLCFTLARGRSHEPARFACVVRTFEDLARALADAAQGAPAHSDAHASDPDARALAAHAARYLRGEPVPWSTLYPDRSGARVSVPTSPWIEARHWPELPTSSRTHAPARSDAPPQTPRSPREAVHDALARALGSQDIDWDASLYQLGGDSIVAMNVVGALAVSLGRKIDVAQLLGAGTLEAFVAEVAHAASAPDAPARTALPAVGERPAYPLSPAQRRIYVMSQLEPGDVRYNMPVALAIDGALDAQRLERCLTKLVARHEMLRAEVVWRDGAPMQRIRPALPFTLETRALEGRDPDHVLRSLVQPFDLTRAPLFRAYLLREVPARHVLLLDLHHLVGDGAALDVLIRELLADYHARPLPALSARYVDHAAWQVAALDAPAQRSQLDFWTAQLAAPLPVLDLPLDAPRPALQRYDGDRVVRTLSPAQAAALRALARAHDATLFALLLAGFSALLGKLSGQRDVIVGAPVSGRTHPDVAGTVGVFINTLAHRTRPAPDVTFAAFLREVAAGSARALAHQEVPLERVLDALTLPRDPSRNPLFDAMLVMQASAFPEATLDGLRWAPTRAPSRTAKVDLALIADVVGEGLALTLEYCTCLLTRASAERMLDQLAHLLDDARDRPDAALADLALEPPAAREALLARFNDTDRPLPDDTCVSLFLDAADAHPGCPALQFGEQTWSYGALAREARRAAHGIRLHTGGARCVIGVLMDPSPAQLVALLGILMTGSAFLPLDPSHPPARTAAILDDADVALVLLDEHAVAPPHLRARALRAGDLIAPGEGPLPLPSHADLAYVIYTSGSTGKPKGVMVDHGNFANLILGLTEALPLEPGRRILAATTLTFDIALLETLLPLALGMTVVLAGRDARADSAELARLIRAHEVHVVQATPTRMRTLLQADLEGALAGVETVLIGGEPFPLDLRTALLARTRAQVFNVYGPTETTVWSTVARVADDAGVIDVGRPIANTRAYVLDAADAPCAVGVPGELCLGGAGVARGYLGRDALTRERFVPDPFVPGARMYRTGDLALWQSDGRLRCLGRRDHQIKLRGHRIEVEEIEQRLLAHPAVAGAVVLKRARPPDREWLTAYLLCRASVPDDALRRALAETLPSIMIPARFVRLEAFPLTSSGKIDRGAFVEPAAHDRADADADDQEAPRGPAETLLAEVLATLLARDRIGRHDDYFALGGDSIVAMQVVGRLRERGVALHVRELIVRQTVARTAPFMRPLDAATDVDDAAEVTTSPLLPFQHWLLEHAGEHVDHYNLTFLLQSTAPLDAARVRDLGEALVRRHPALRLRFDLARRGARVAAPEELAPAHRLAFAHLDARREPDPQRAIRDAAEALQRRLDVREGPLLAVAVMHAPEGDLLLLAAHQLVIDHVSWRIVLHELAEALGADAPSPALAQAPARAPCAWYRRLDARADADEVRAELPYWTDVARAARLARIPVDRPEGSNRFGDLASTWLRCLEVDETRTLLAHLDGHGPRALEALLIAALGRALSAWTGDGTHVLGLGSHGRSGSLDDLDVSDVVGRFTSLYPLALSGLDRPADAALLAHVQRTLAAVPRDGIGYGLLRYLRPSVSNGALDVSPEVAFSYMGQFDGDVRTRAFGFSALPTGAPIHPHIARPHRLGVLALVAWGALQLRIDYSCAQYDEATMEALAEGFRAALAELLAHLGDPHRPARPAQRPAPHAARASSVRASTVEGE